MDATASRRLLADVDAFCEEIRPIEELCYVEHRFNDQVVPLARKHNVLAMPRDENTAPAYILGAHRTVRPDARRGDVAGQLYFDTWALTLVDVLHVPGCITGLYPLASGTSIPQLAYTSDGN